MELPSPALDCTSTRWPASCSAVTLPGTRPTRASWSLTSFGTPMIIWGALRGSGRYGTAYGWCDFCHGCMFRPKAHHNQRFGRELTVTVEFVVILEAAQGVHRVAVPLP